MRNRTCILILENIRSVENTGSIFRSASRLGVSKIILIGTTPAPLDRFGRKRRDFSKVALGAENEMEWEYHKGAESIINDLKNDDFQIISLEQTSSAKNIKGFHASDRFALVVGNEVEGVSRKALELSDIVVEVPVQGEKRSLNVSVATGISLFVLLLN